jgi:acetamidase/formamidase
MSLTARQAYLNAIKYMKKFGYTGEQAYAILGTAPIEGHISSLVDIPKLLGYQFPNRWCLSLHL